MAKRPIHGQHIARRLQVHMIWTAVIHVVAEMGAPAALVGPYGLCDQSYGHGFDWESLFELGE